MTSASPALPSYTEQIEILCNMRTVQEVQDDEYSDETRAAIEATAKTYGKPPHIVYQDVETESPEVVRRNREDDDDKYGHLNLGP